MRRTVHVNAHRTAIFISVLLFFLPCIISLLTNKIIGNALIYLAYYLLAFLLGIYGIQSSGYLKINQKQFICLFVWIVLTLIIILNNNGDFENDSYRSIANWTLCVLFTFIILMHKNLQDTIMKIMLLLLLFQLAAGYYFLIFPGQLLSLSGFFGLEGIWLSKFVSQVNAGYFMGFTSHYSTSGMYMAWGSILSAAFLLNEKLQNKKWRIADIILFIAFFAALILTGKRGHILFTTVALILIYLVGYVRGGLSKKLKQILSFIIIFIVVFLIALQIPAFQNTIERFMVSMLSSDLNDTSSDRIDELWIPALEEFKEHPLTGIGWRQFKYLHPMSNGANNDCHNIYLQLLCETGILGFCCFMAVFIYNYVLAWKTLLKEKRKKQSNSYLPILFAFGYQTFFLLYGLTGNPLYDIQCYLPYMVSCAFVYKYSEKNKRIRFSFFRS